MYHINLYFNVHGLAYVLLCKKGVISIITICNIASVIHKISLTPFYPWLATRNKSFLVDSKPHCDSETSRNLSNLLLFIKTPTKFLLNEVLICPFRLAFPMTILSRFRKQFVLLMKGKSIILEWIWGYSLVINVRIIICFVFIPVFYVIQA